MGCESTCSSTMEKSLTIEESTAEPEVKVSTKLEEPSREIIGIFSLDIVTGPCRGFFPSFGFDGERCVEFVYGGCDGNANNFMDKNSCKRTCMPGSRVSGVVKT